MSIDIDKKISIVIPVYNEGLTIRSFMDSLEAFKNNCEIIFVDGGSGDGSHEIIQERHRLVSSPKRGRANQMNYGASLTRGDIILFLHADSILPKDALSQIQNVVSKGSKVGCFRIKFQSKTIILMKICGLMSDLRVALRNIAFGDQGIFIRRDYFNHLGGFKDLPLMEDYQLSIDIKADGEKIGLAKSSIQTSERRFVENGRLKTMARMQRLQHMYRKGVDVEKIARLYK